VTRTTGDHEGISLTEVVAFLDDILQTATTPDYQNALNGLQLTNSGSITRIAVAVDFSTEVVDAVVTAEANFLLVHHGMFWSGLQPFVGGYYSRLRSLLNADVAVYASHLPLDRHGDFGNNVLLARTLGLNIQSGFAHFKDIPIGVQGSSDIETSILVDRVRTFSRKHGGDAIVAGRTSPEARTRRWGICTGAGASSDTLNEASREGIDTLIVGEGPHWTAVDAADRGVTIIYAGHYASETLGVYALGSELSRHFQVDCIRISAPTRL